MKRAIYHVHVYRTAALIQKNVRAKSPEEACQKAIKMVKEAKAVVKGRESEVGLAMELPDSEWIAQTWGE
jgi:hypothetical protein